MLFRSKGDSLYAYFLDRPQGPRVTIPGIRAAENTKVQVLGASAPSTWKENGRDLAVDIAQAKPGPYALGLKLTPAPAE